MTFHDTSVLHWNLGWESINEGDGQGFQHGLLKAIRGEFGITDRITLLAEFAVKNFEDCFYQGGTRIGIIPGWLETAPGHNIGLAFTPVRLL